MQLSRPESIKNFFRLFVIDMIAKMGVDDLHLPSARLSSSGRVDGTGHLNSHFLAPGCFGLDLAGELGPAIARW